MTYEKHHSMLYAIGKIERKMKSKRPVLKNLRFLLEAKAVEKEGSKSRVEYSELSYIPSFIGNRTHILCSPWLDWMVPKVEEY